MRVTFCGFALLGISACSGAPSVKKAQDAELEAAPAIPAAEQSPTTTASAAPPGASAVAPDAPRAQTPAQGLWPAGTCGFDAYLSGPCDTFEAPRFAVVLGEFAGPLIPSRRFKRMSDDVSTWRAPSRALFGDLPVRPQDEIARAERALEAARTLGLAAGYPFAVSYDDLPPLDERKRGVAIVAGLYATEAEAKALIDSKRLEARVVELAPALAAQMDCEGDWEACSKTHISVVEMLAPAKAYSTAQLDKVTAAQENLPWVKYDKAVARFMKALEASPAACELKPGRLFLSGSNRLYRQLRMFAPVTCPDGKEAWVPWRATRLQSAVTRNGNEAIFHQVVLVECDSPTVEDRPFLPTLPEKLALDAGGCRG